MRESEVELRHLYELNQELLKQLKIARDEAVGWFDDSRGFDPKAPPDWLSGIDAAIAKATNA